MRSNFIYNFFQCLIVTFGIVSEGAKHMATEVASVCLGSTDSPKFLVLFN